MIAKMKVRNEEHHLLDEVLDRYKLKAIRLFPSNPLILQVEYDSSTNAGHEMLSCWDVLEFYIERGRDLPI